MNKAGSDKTLNVTSTSIDVRDATSKAMYGRLFGWIVNKVNQLLAPPLASRGEEVTEIGKSETG